LKKAAEACHIECAAQKARKVAKMKKEAEKQRLIEEEDKRK